MIPSQTLPDASSAPIFDPRSAIYAQLGAVSPFWLLYASAASAGVAYWWFSRWREATNLEALFGQVATAPAIETPEAEEVAVEASVPEPEAASDLEAGFEAMAEPMSAKPKASRAGRPVVDDIGPA